MSRDEIVEACRVLGEVIGLWLADQVLQGSLTLESVQVIPQAQLLTYAEAANLLHVSSRTLRRKIEAGELPTVSCGGRIVRIRRSAVERYLKTLEAHDGVSCQEAERPCVDSISEPQRVAANSATRRCVEAPSAATREAHRHDSEHKAARPAA